MSNILFIVFLSFLGTIIFDIFISSGSSLIFRGIYDIAFMLIIFVVIYDSVLLLKNRELPKKGFSFILPKSFFILPLLLNLKVIASVFWLHVPDLGGLNDNTLIQGLGSLFPLLDYLVMALINSIVLYIAINRKNNLSFYEIPTYALVIMAVETSLANYGFHLGGVAGIRWGLSILHLAICGLNIWLFCKRDIVDISIKLGSPDVLLVLLSLGLIMLVYVPFGIYSLFGDNAISIDAAISIIYRGSLQPFHIIDEYYNPLGGFVSLVFAYTIGLNNLLLSSSLPFLIGHLMLPFVIYCFLKKFVAEDSRIIIIGTVMTMLMDGLAVVLLPHISVRGLTNEVINWSISPATKSLYNSSIGQIWLMPYKTLSIASALAVCNPLHRRSRINLLLSGALLFFSFGNPRQPFIAFLILIFLFGIKKIDLKELFTIILAGIIFLGPLFPVIVFKTSAVTLDNLNKIGLMADEVKTKIILPLSILTDNALPLASLAILGSIIGVVYLIRLDSKNKAYARNLTSQFLLNRGTRNKLMIKGKLFELPITFHEIFFSELSIYTLIFIVLYAYQYISGSRWGNILIDQLIYLILRYHILIVLISLSLLLFKYNKRILITFIFLFLLIYLGLLMKPILYAPLIIVVMALPTFTFFVKFRRKLGTFVVILFVLLGVFSAPLYSSIVETPKAGSRYIDLPEILQVLLKEDFDERVFLFEELYNKSTLVEIHYYVDRIVKMANLRLTQDPSCQLYIIDRSRSLTVEQNQTVENATKTMKKGHVCAVIVTEKEKPVGILTERNIVESVDSHGLDPVEVKVKEVMRPIDRWLYFGEVYILIPNLDS